MGAKREQKLRVELREIKALREYELELHKQTVAVLDALRQMARPSMGKILWYESCIDEYRRCKEVGLVKDPF